MAAIELAANEALRVRLDNGCQACIRIEAQESRGCPYIGASVEGAAAVGVVADFRQCPVPDALEGIEVREFLGLCRELGMPQEGGLADQTPAFVDAYYIYKRAKSAAQSADENKQQHLLRKHAQWLKANKQAD